MVFSHKLNKQTLVQFKYNLTDHSLRLSRETLILMAVAHTNTQVYQILQEYAVDILYFRCLQ